MKNTFICIIQIFFLTSSFCHSQSEKEGVPSSSKSYFPVNNGITLVYGSSFGESITKYFQDGAFIISLSEADDFKYRQTFIIKDDGVYTSKTYQHYKIFLFINKESTVTYEKPLLRFPLPLLEGIKWQWEGNEYSDGEMNTVKVSGKTFDKEFVITKAGKFNAIKLETIIESGDNVKNRVTEWYAEGLGLIKAKIIIEGGGMMGLLRDILGYGTIKFELEEIRKE